MTPAIHFRSSFRLRSLAGLPARLLFVLCLLGGLAGCTSMAPHYERPAAPIPDTYSASHTVNGQSTVAGKQVAVSADSQSVPAASLFWEAYFSDPVLVQLIHTALAHNRDMRLALLRVEEARAASRIQRSERFPAVGVGAQSARSRVPGDLNPLGQPVIASEHRAEVGISSWELDLWGRVASLEDAALQRWLATGAARQAAQVALVAGVANAYLALQELNEQVDIARRSVATRQETYRIFQRRYDVGSTSRLDVTQVHTLLTQAQSLLVQLEMQRDEQLNALRVLLGSSPDEALLSRRDGVVLPPVQAGLPSELLTSRPDIIAAEHRLRAANADIGAARAAFFPSISLTGSVGTASAQLDGLFDRGSRAWAFVPVVSLPIFDGGRRSAALDLSEVRRDMAVAEYEKTVQVAFQEVSDALAASHWLQQQLEVQELARETQVERARLAQLRYDRGASAYLEVLDAQRDLLSTEQQLVQTRRALQSSRVALYSALGGGPEPLDSL